MRTANGVSVVLELQEHCSRVDTSYRPVVNPSSLHSEYGDGQAAHRASAAASAVREALDGRILFVGHGASCLGLVEAFGGGGYVGYCSLSHFRLAGSRWQTVGRQGDVAHLSDKQTSLSSAF